MDASGETVTRWGYAVRLPEGNYTISTNVFDDSVWGVIPLYLDATIVNTDGGHKASYVLCDDDCTYTQTIEINYGDVIYLTSRDASNLTEAMTMFEAFDIQIEVGIRATSLEPYNGGVFASDEPIPALPGINHIWIGNGDVEVRVTGRADPNAVIEKLITRLAALEAALVNT